MREKLRNAGYEIREYQITAARQAVEVLHRAKHVEIDLPSGAGRTLIAQLTAWLWLEKAETGRVLWVVPQRLQVGALAASARWLAPEVLPLGLTPEQMRNPLTFRGLAYAHRLYVSTPTLLTNAIQRARFPRERLAEIGLVVIADYESSLVADEDSAEKPVRWRQDLLGLMRLLPTSARYVLLSASSPVAAVQAGSKDKLAASFAAFIQKELGPVSLDIAPEAYRPYLSPAQVSFLRVADDFVWGAHEALLWQARDLMAEMGAAYHCELDEEYLLANLEKIAGFRLGALPATQGGTPISVIIDGDLRQMCYQLRGIIAQSALLFEDMFDGLTLQWKRVESTFGHQTVTADRPFLVDERSEPAYHARLEGKGFALEDLVQERQGKQGLILTRYAELAQAITEILAETTADVSVMARDALDSSADLSALDYVVFYSVGGDNGSTWLELSRLRQLIDRIPETIFLCYDATSEEQRARALAEEMGLAQRGYELAVSMYEG